MNTDEFIRLVDEGKTVIADGTAVYKKENRYVAQNGMFYAFFDKIEKVTYGVAFSMLIPSYATDKKMLITVGGLTLDCCKSVKIQDDE